MSNRPPHLTYFSGLDLGRPHEFTAVAVLERSRPSARASHDPGALRYAVRHLERFAPGTPYPEAFARLAALFAARPLAGSTLVVDQTAVGRPVLESLRRSRVRAAIRAITVTAGHAARRDERGGWLLPKQELVGTLQVLLQSGRLRVAEALPEAGTLLRELESFRADVGHATGDAVESWRERDRDDLVLAVAIATWEGERHGPAATGAPGVWTPGGMRARVWEAGA